MKELKLRIRITCVSFTVSLMLICLTNQLAVSHPDIRESFVTINDIYQMFFLNVFINGSIFVTDKCLPIQSNITYFAVGILQVYLSIILIGGVVFDLVPLTLGNIITMAILSVVIYMMVIGITMVKNKNDERIINEKLKKGKYRR